MISVNRGFILSSRDFLLGSQPSRTDEALLEISVPAADGNLASHVPAMAAPLYQRCGIAGLSRDGVHAELTRMRQIRLNQS